MNNLKWKAISAIGAMHISFWFNLPWVLGIILLAWVIPDIQSGQTHFFENLSKHRDPVLYWLVIATWIFFGLYLVNPTPTLLR